MLTRYCTFLPHSCSFRVVSFSSEDHSYPAEELNVHSPSTKGWQSARYCEYPQELGFEMIGNRVKLSQVQILSHQSKISMKIEIFIGHGDDYFTAKFRRLGYLSLDSNEKSSFQARELKTVYIDHPATYVRFVIHRNFVNNVNMHNQVGLVAVNFAGLDEGRGGAIRQSGEMAAIGDMFVDLNLDPQTASRLKLLADAKSRAVAEEDYPTAKSIKQAEADLKNLGSRLARLDADKKEAVRYEDYDRAKDIKDEADSLRGDIERKVMSIRIPGVTDAGAAKAIKSKSKYSPKNEDYYDDEFEDDNIDVGFDDDARGSMSRFDDDRGAKRTSPARRKSEPLNIDELPVHGGKGGNYDYDAMDDSDMPPAMASSGSKPRRTGPRGGADRETIEDDRPIKGRPNAAFYEDPDAFDENDPQQRRNSDAGPGMGMHAELETEDFPPGQHPLEDVPNLANLPTPEALSYSKKDQPDQAALVQLFGEYIVRCLQSKHWVLREAALAKVTMNLPQYEGEPGLQSCMPSLISAVKIGVDDRIQQVFFGAISLLENVLESARRAKIGKATMAPLADPIVVNLVEKLADGNSRIREVAKKSLDEIAASSSIGPAVVAAHGLKSLNAKQKTAWRPLMSRLQLLADLVNRFGVGAGSTSGLAVDSVMGFPKTYGAFSHSNGEVRDAAKELTVAVQKKVGTAAIDSYLSALRPKQLEEYYVAFDEPMPARAPAEADAKPAREPTREPRESSKQHKGGAKQHTPQQSKEDRPGSQSSEAQASARNAQTAPVAEAEEDFTCSFCGAGDKSWNEDVLDMHYLKDCPLLAPCPACAQVLEIAALPDHLLDECDHKEDYVPCDVTGLAIRAEEFDAWKISRKCVPPPDNCFYCPMCLTAVNDSNDDWKQHLVKACRQNLRIKR